MMSKEKYILLQPRFEHPTGTIVYPSAKHDYGLARDDSNSTGVEHISVSLNNDGDYPFFTIPRDHLAKVVDDASRKRFEELARRVDAAYIPRYDMWQMDSETMEEFAQLLVKRCAYLVNDYQRTTGYTDYAKMLCREFDIEFKEQDYWGK